MPHVQHRSVMGSAVVHGGQHPAVLDDGRALSTPFPWARLGEPRLRAEACAAGLSLVETWHDGTSAYAVLVPR